MESIPVRAYLLHLTHYDPEWDEKRWRDVPSDIGLALEIVDAMATARMNTLIVDIADGVEFATHPELKRAHTLPRAELRRIASLAKTRGIDVIPKLNFSKGDAFRHNAWMAPRRARGRRGLLARRLRTGGRVARGTWRRALLPHRHG
ncbi:MAG: hypothetical protein R3A78_02005 [Polyangiales bacterium]